MYRVSIELYKHEWKFGRTRNSVGTRAADERFHSFFEFERCEENQPTCNVFWVATAQFILFSMQETAPFTFYDWVRLQQPSNMLFEVQRYSTSQTDGATSIWITVCGNLNTKVQQHDREIFYFFRLFLE